MNIEKGLRRGRRGKQYVRLAGASMFALVLFSFCPGCGDSGPEIAGVEGFVTLDGKPLPEAFVYFRHADGGRISRAITDESGRYRLHFNSSDAGAIVGANTVRISTFIEPDFDDFGRRIPGTGHKEVVPKKYNQESELKVEVQPRKNNLNFELTTR